MLQGTELQLHPRNIAAFDQDVGINATILYSFNGGEFHRNKSLQCARKQLQCARNVLTKMRENAYLIIYYNIFLLIY
jgi:hypothetical protein